ncbi:MAG: (deoxy)nucleoside triphosphate pyrophosphohydrolase [Pseudomonadota bacterium]
MPNLLIVSACALVDGDGRVLLAKRPEGKPEAGLWEFPGGKLMANETPETALVRELKEELDIDTETACLAPIGFASQPMGDRHLLMPLFVCRKWTGVAKPIASEALAWARPNEFKRYPMPAADRPLAAQLRDVL